MVANSTAYGDISANSISACGIKAVMFRPFVLILRALPWIVAVPNLGMIYRLRRCGTFR
jgi:hypothetical protein